MSEFEEKTTTESVAEPVTEEKKPEETLVVAPSSRCATPGCPKPGHMACPTCLKLGMAPTKFCSQECFKTSWNDHKLLHKDVKAVKLDPKALPSEFLKYRFTGSLRPCQKSARRAVPAHIKKPDYADDARGTPYGEQNDKRSTIRVYKPAEILLMREACRIGREVLDIAGRAVRVGITTDEIDRIVHEATIERGAYPSPLNYFCFPKSVCTSVNEVICHGIPDMRELEDGDIVNIDVSIYKDGFHADLNETFFVGGVDERSVALVECAYKCLSAAVDIVRPGTLYRDCGEAIARVAKQFKCTVNQTYCGHGIGELFHTSPNIPHYDKNKAKGSMQAGHIFTIEPMINLGNYRDMTWPDGWTAVSIDGSRSSQFEHTILVTETGCELLTARIGESKTKMEWTREKFQR